MLGINRTQGIRLGQVIQWYRVHIVYLLSKNVVKLRLGCCRLNLVNAVSVNLLNFSPVGLGIRRHGQLVVCRLELSKRPVDFVG